MVEGEPAGGPASQAFAILITLPIFAFYAALGIYVQTRQRNYVWNSSTLGANRFESTLSVRSMVFILLSNVVAIVVSLGLLIPWAQIRLARYRAEQMTLHLEDNWRDYAASKDGHGSSLGEEIGQAFDVEVDFAL